MLELEKKKICDYVQCQASPSLLHAPKPFITKTMQETEIMASETLRVGCLIVAVKPLISFV